MINLRKNTGLISTVIISILKVLTLKYNTGLLQEDDKFATSEDASSFYVQLWSVLVCDLVQRDSCH